MSDRVGSRCRLVLAAVLLALTGALVQAQPGPCGELLTLPSQAGGTLRLALQATPSPSHTLVLLAGGSGHVDLDDAGCPRALRGNSLLRSMPLWRQAGFALALVDAPSSHQGEDGLAGFRTAPEHAQDLGAVIAALRARSGGSVWLLGTSRGTISAFNAAARLRGEQAPDGLVLSSVLTVGQAGARKRWVAQTVFDLPLEQVRQPVLLVGHALDACPRSPPGQMAALAGRLRVERLQVVTVSGGPGAGDAAGLLACEGRAPHGFVDQEAEVAAGMARFIRGGNY